MSPSAAFGTSVRDSFAAALMDMCRERDLKSITVASLAEKTGLTRQTFYNHFSNLDDLVYYAGSRHLIMENRAIEFKAASIRKAYQYALDHREFFMQLAAQVGHNSYQETAVRWLKHKSYETFITPGLSQSEALRRRTQIDLFHSGSAHVMFDWLARGMVEPIDAVVDAICEMLPDFMRNESQHIVTIDYPR